MSENTAQNQPEPEEPNLFIRIVTNPILLGVFTFIGLPISLYSLFVSKEAKTVYKVLSNVVVTEKGASSKIRVYYDSVEVDNVQAVTIALWNAGNTFLGKEEFSEDKPVSIMPTLRGIGPVQILEAKVAATTRADLQFELTTHHNSISSHRDTVGIIASDDVSMKIRGDEGFEAGDGVSVVILYTSSTSCNWEAKARIKGYPKGIIEVNSRSERLNWGDTALGIAYIIFITFSYLSKRDKKLLGSARAFKIGQTGLLLLIIIFVGFLFYQFFTAPEVPDALVK